MPCDCSDMPMPRHVLLRIISTAKEWADLERLTAGQRAMARMLADHAEQLASAESFQGEKAEAVRSMCRYLSCFVVGYDVPGDRTIFTPCPFGMDEADCRA